jgi:hypothetical protein
MADKWEMLTERVDTRFDSLRKDIEEQVKEAHKELLSEISSAKHYSILVELRKINGRLDKIEERLPEERLPEEEPD